MVMKKIGRNPADESEGSRETPKEINLWVIDIILDVSAFEYNSV